MRYSTEPLFWSLFAAGGVIVALLVPALIVLTGFVVPAERIEFSRLEDIFRQPVLKIALFGLAASTFLHWANRFRHTLSDMGLRRFRTPLTVASYTAALVGSAWTAAVLVIG
jgi:fumarate reductase subunit D